MILPGVAAGVPVLQSGTLVIQDDFVDTDGTALDAHTISPTNVNSDSWAQIGLLGTFFTISGNTAIPEDPASTCLARIYNYGVNYSDAIITIDASTEYSSDLDMGFHGIALRVVDEFNLAYVILEPAPGTNNFRIHSMDAGTDTIVAQTTVIEAQQVDNVAFTMKATVSGTTVTAELSIGGNNYSITGTISSNLAEPAHGIYHNGMGTYTYHGVETFYLRV